VTGLYNSVEFSVLHDFGEREDSMEELHLRLLLDRLFFCQSIAEYTTNLKVHLREIKRFNKIKGD
jgi:hypothetical protein